MIKIIILTAALMGGFFMSAHANCLTQDFIKKHAPGHIYEITGKGALAYSIATLKKAHPHLYIVERGEKIAVLPVEDDVICFAHTVSPALHMDGLIALNKVPNK